MRKNTDYLFVFLLSLGTCLRCSFNNTNPSNTEPAPKQDNGQSHAFFDSFFGSPTPEKIFHKYLGELQAAGDSICVDGKCSVDFKPNSAFEDCLSANKSPAFIKIAKEFSLSNEKLEHNLLGSLLDADIDPNAIVFMTAQLDFNTIIRNSEILVSHAKTNLSSSSLLKLLFRQLNLQYNQLLNQDAMLDHVASFMANLIETQAAMLDFYGEFPGEFLFKVAPGDKSNPNVNDLLLSFYDKFLHTLKMKIKDPDLIDKLTVLSHKKTREKYVSISPHLIENRFANLKTTANKPCKNTIPPRIHHIWLTNKTNPKEISAEDLKILVQSKKILIQSSIDFEETVWTNNPKLLPRSKNILDQLGIKLRDIAEFKETLPNYALVSDLITHEKWGMASDILRYDLVDHWGGIYYDLNFNLKRSPDEIMCNYDFVGIAHNAFYMIENYFFAARKGHPILKKVQTIIRDHFTQPEPKYISAIRSLKIDELYTNLATAYPFYWAFYAEANKNAAMDVIYPNCKLKVADISGPAANCKIARERFHNEDSQELLKELCTFGEFKLFDDALASQLSQKQIDRSCFGFDPAGVQTWNQ